MRNLILPIIGSFIFFSGCANLDVAQKEYLKGDYNTSLQIYQKWAKRGFPKAKLKLAKMAERGIVKNSPKFIIENAKYAYNHGYNKAANLIFINYYKLGNYQKSFYWLPKIIYNVCNQEQFDAYINFIQNHIKIFKTQIFYIKKLEHYANQSKNQKAFYTLGKFYENSYFKDLNKSLYYYKLAYENGNINAGTKLALLYIYQLHKPNKGLKLLKNIADEDNGASAYNIAIFLLHRMNKELQKLNQHCISFAFHSPKEFFTKKIEAKLFKDKFLKNNVASWLNYSYKRGYLGAKFELVSIDLGNRNFDKKNNLSHLDLQEAIEFLENEKLFRAKMVLAKIYEFYPNLHRLPIAKNIYLEYINYNKIDAYWHLYQFYKRFAPNNKQKEAYLDYLVQKNFEPAIIEKAFFDITLHKNIEKNYKLLKYYSEQNNIKALTYLSSIYSKGIIPHTKKLTYPTLNKLCKLTSPINPSLDLKIANYYFLKQDLSKSATLYQYYADQNISDAAYNLSSIYQRLKECKKSIRWLKIAKENGHKKAELKYATLILKGQIDGNTTKAFNIVKSYAIQNDPESLTLLGDIYRQGIVTKFDPIKAQRYYQKAIDLGFYKAYLKLISLYKILNDYGQYNKKIIALYKKLYEAKHSDKILLQMAEFYVKTGKFNKAKEIIMIHHLNHYDQGRYLLYTIEGKKQFTGKPHISKEPKLTLLYAKHLLKSNKRKSLYYAFIASLQNANGSNEFILRILKYFKPSTVRKIYKNAKKAYKIIYPSH